MAIDYEQAKVLLNNSYEKAAQELPAAVTQYITDNKDALDTIFSSKTQSYREVLLGCAVARYQDRSSNIRHPYVKQGEDAFNGRTLDEKAVNPFLFSKQIPCSKGPYLATFRRNVTFTEDTRDGLRDKEGFDALLSLISTLEAVSESDEVETIIIALLKCFIDLREQSIVRLVPIRRLRIDQYRMFLKQTTASPERRPYSHAPDGCRLLHYQRSDECGVDHRTPGDQRRRWCDRRTR